MSGLDEKLLPCPFCGGEAVLEMAIPCHSGAWVQCVECDARSCSFKGKDADDSDAIAIAAWNRRAPASVPEDVAGVVERLRGYRPANEWGDPVQHTICDEAASALARVAKERDEARATLDEVCLSNRQEWQRATSAEAKLAEALAAGSMSAGIQASVPPTSSAA